MDLLQELQYYLEQANDAAQSKDWPSLAEQTLRLLQEACQAEAGIFYNGIEPTEKPEKSSAEERLTPWVGCPQGLSQTWWAALRKKLAQPMLFQGDIFRWIDRDTANVEPVIQQAFANLSALQNMLVLPIKNPGSPPAGVLLINSATLRLDLAQWIIGRLSTELEKAWELDEIRRREARLMALNDILGQLGANLNPDEVLRIFIARSRQFLQVEAVSLFLMDEASGELILRMASQSDDQIPVEKIRVPRGVGIIGRVTQTGETLLVEDVKNDQRHYNRVDQLSGFTTRSILAVPMRSRPIDLGQGRGTSHERIIGGLEAINKIGGPFRTEDIELLQILAKGASTIMIIAQLYVDANNMYFDVLHALVGAIDAKDPGTTGRSQRISDFSAEIASELGLQAEEIYSIRLGSLVQNIQATGLSETIYQKTGALRLPIINNILAVASTFDIMTSDTSVSADLLVEEAFEYLREQSGKRFNCDCVEALARAYQRGNILTRGDPRMAE